MKFAEEGIKELQPHVDTLIVIPNQNLFRIANENTTFQEAFRMADDVLHAGVRGVTDLITSPGLVNLDFADIKTVMGEKGKAMMGTGESSGEDRAIKAAEAAIANPLLDQNSMFGACGVLINITGGKDMTLYEVDSAANRIREEVGESDANIIFGSTFNPDLEGTVRVSVVATGIDQEKAEEHKSSHSLVDEDDELLNEMQSPPEFNEYSGGIQNNANELQENIDNMSQQVDLNNSFLSEENQIQEDQVAPRKVSLFKRMWNSLISSDSEEVVVRSNNAKSLSQQQNKKENNSAVKEAESFFKEKM